MDTTDKQEKQQWTRQTSRKAAMDTLDKQESSTGHDSEVAGKAAPETIERQQEKQQWTRQDKQDKQHRKPQTRRKKGKAGQTRHIRRALQSRTDSMAGQGRTGVEIQDRTRQKYKEKDLNWKDLQDMKGEVT